MNHETNVKFFVSTKADMLTLKVNAWLNEMRSIHGDGFDVNPNIMPFMSYTTIKDKGAYMIGCMVSYILFDEEDSDETKKDLN